MKKPKYCIICQKPFECYEVDKGGRGIRNSGKKRSSNSITCSKKCARDYQRIYNYMHIKIRQNIEKETYNQIIIK